MRKVRLGYRVAVPRRTICKLSKPREAFRIDQAIAVKKWIQRELIENDLKNSDILLPDNCIRFWSI